METKSDGLTARQREFARLVACGHTQATAYKLAYDVRRAKPETVARNASKLMHNTHIATMVREMLREARIEDIVSVGEAVKFILEGRERAIAAGNSTAEAAFTLQITKITGMNRESVLVGAEKSESDSELVARLSGGDPHKATMLRSIIGKDSFA